MSAELHEFESILDKRQDPSSSRRVQYLVKWRNYPKEEATWEQRSSLVADGLLQELARFDREHGNTPKKRKKRPQSQPPAARGNGAEEGAEAADADADAEEAEARPATADAAEAPQRAAEAAPVDYAAVGDSAAKVVPALRALAAFGVAAAARVAAPTLLAGALAPGQAELVASAVDASTGVVATVSLLRLRGGDEPHQKWLAAALIWATASAALPHLDDANAAPAAVFSAVTALVAAAVAMSASDGKDEPGWGTGAGLVCGASVVAALNAAWPVVSALGDDNRFLVIVFAAVAATAVWRAAARIGLGAASPTSGLATPQWMGLAGVVAFSVSSGVFLLQHVGALSLSRAAAAAPQTCPAGYAEEGSSCSVSAPDSLSLTLVIVDIFAVGLLALSGVLARHRSSA